MTDAAAPEALTDRVAFLLQIALARAQAMGEQVLVEHGVTGREYGVLAVVARSEAATQNAVGRTLGFDRTTTMTLVTGLVSRGLLTRSRQTADRRAYRISLTARGERVRRAAARALADCDERFLAVLTPAQRRGLVPVLRRLADG